MIEMNQIKIYWIIEVVLLFALMMTGSVGVWMLSVLFVFGTWCFEGSRYVNYYDTHYHEEYRSIIKSSKHIRAGLRAQLEFTPQPPDEELKRRQRRFQLYLRSVLIWMALMPTVVIIRFLIWKFIRNLS